MTEGKKVANKMEQDVENKKIAKQMSDFFGNELERAKFLQNNETAQEKEAKKILQWIAETKKEKQMIIATLTEDVKATIMYDIADRGKTYKTSKGIQEVKETLEYINAEVCKESEVLVGISVQEMQSPKLAYTVVIDFAK